MNDARESETHTNCSQDHPIKWILRSPGGQDPDLVVLYGSRRADADVDLLAVYPSAPTRRDHVIGRIDLLALSRDEFGALLSLADPEVTEPILTGEWLLGDESMLRRAQDVLEGVEHGASTIRHLLRRGVQAYADSAAFLDAAMAGRAEASAFAALNLSFAASYFAFARHYKQAGKGAVTLDTIIEASPPALRSVLVQARRLKRQGAACQAAEASALVGEFEVLLLGS